MVKKIRKKDSFISWKLKKMRMHHKIIFTLLGTVGVVLVWRGLWNIFDSYPVFNDPWITAGLGFILVIASGIFFRLI